MEGWQQFLFGGGLVSVVVAIGGFIVQWRNDRHKEPIDKDTAEAANELTRIEASNSVTAHALKLVESLTGRVSALEAAHAEQEKRASEYERRNVELARHLEEFIEWGRDIQNRWTWWRQQDKPPRLPETRRR